MKFTARLFTSFFFTAFSVWPRPASFEIGSTDFAALVENGTYIDKSLIVRTFAEQCSIERHFHMKRFFISAPRNFGKTVNILTLKHYFEIEVDENGNEIIDKKKTKNYNLFKKLKIFEHREFFNATFGRRPVIHVNFEPMKRITNNRTMRENFKTVILQASLQHNYLSNVKNSTIRQMYNNYMDYIITEKNPKRINFGFDLTFLEELLIEHFDRSPIALYDSCEAIFDAIVFGNTTEDVKRIVSRYHTMFSYSPYCCFATGTFYIADSRVDEYDSCDEEAELPDFWGFLPEYAPYQCHPFREYYGINDRELCELLKFTDDPVEAKKLKADISEFYGSYTSDDGRTTYKTFSALKYLQNRKLGDPHALRSYWKAPAFVESIRHLLNRKTVRERVLAILKNETDGLDNFLFSIKYYLIDAEYLKEHIREGFHDEQEAEYLFEYLTSLGYLKLRNGIRAIPNLEMRSEIESILRQGVSDDGNEKIDRRQK